MKINLNFYIHFLHLSSLISSGLDSKESTCITVLISHGSKVTLKILQARLQQYVNRNFQMFKLVLEKAEEPEIKLPTSAGSQKMQGGSRKTSTSALLTMLKSLIDHNKLWEILKEMGIPDHFTFLLRNLHAGQEPTVNTRHGTMLLLLLLSRFSCVQLCVTP